MARVETLDANRQAVDSAGRIAAEFFCLEGAGVGLHGDLGAGFERQQAADVGHQSIQPLRRHQARRTAADKNRHDPAAPYQRQRLLQISPQRIKIRALGQLATGLVRVEVAVRTLAHAPGEMHVQRQRRQGRQVQDAGLQVAVDDAPRRSLQHLGPNRNHCSFSISARNAWPRCDSRFLSSAVNSATVLPSAGTKKCGS